MIGPKVKSLIGMGRADNVNKAVDPANGVSACDNDSKDRKGSPPPILSSKVAGKSNVAAQNEPPLPVPTAAPAPAQIEVVNKVPVKQVKRKVLDANAQCLHGTRRTICKHCKGNSLCEHLKQRQWCEICRPGSSGARCLHGKQRSKCAACGGSGICVHLKLRVVCSVCKYLKMQMF